MTSAFGNGTNENYTGDVIVAALNEEEGMGLTLVDMLRYVKAKNVLVIDGHSSDRTVEVAKDMGAQVLVQDRIGKGDALKSGSGGCPVRRQQPEKHNTQPLRRQAGTALQKETPLIILLRGTQSVCNLWKPTISLERTA